MKLKQILIGGGILTLGYTTGKIVGYVKCTKCAIDIFDDIAPGSKEILVKSVSEKIISFIFKTNKKD